ncbi:hypothetical protein LguiB_027326 [Lonicera macranthoides]
MSMGEKVFCNLEISRAKPYLLVILVQFGYAGMVILAKTALNQGMNHYTFAVYRNAIATLFFAPFAIFFERKVRPPMTISTFFKIMVLGFLEPVLDQNLYYAGMAYTSATFAVAMCNILPALTFLMAWIFRLERVNLKSIHSHGKIVGTVVTVGGAMIMTLIKGHTIGLPWTKTHTINSESSSTSVHQDPTKGSIMITIGCFCWASFVILQAVTLKTYPAELSLTALICGGGTLQGAILTLIVETGNTSIWSIHFDTKLLAALYSGLICTGLSYYISGIIMREKGPVFATAFNPLSMVIVAIMGSFILSEQLDIGRVIGAIIIVIGLYLVIWGKSKDRNLSNSNKDDQIVDVLSVSSTSKVPIIETV